MLLHEIATSRQDLQWKQHGELHEAEFFVDGNKYGISVIEDTIDGFNAIRVDYHFEASDGTLNHGVTGLNSGAFRILGIVGNGVLEKFKPAPEIVYFVLKKRLCTALKDGVKVFDQKQFEQKKAVYARLRDKFAAELEYHKWGTSDGEDQVFFVCKTSQIKDAVVAFYAGD